jgi:hypothetical protein
MMCWYRGVNDGWSEEADVALLGVVKAGRKACPTELMRLWDFKDEIYVLRFSVREQIIEFEKPNICVSS